MTCPITMTESARAHIQKFINAAKKPVTFRLAVKKSGCSGYAYLVDIAEEPQKNDLSLLKEIETKETEEALAAKSTGTKPAGTASAADKSSTIW